jgi:hypothetical protein
VRFIDHKQAFRQESRGQLLCDNILHSHGHRLACFQARWVPESAPS